MIGWIVLALTAYVNPRSTRKSKASEAALYHDICSQSRHTNTPLRLNLIFHFSHFLTVVSQSRYRVPNTVCLGKTKSLGFLQGLSTDHFDIIEWAKHSEGDLWKRAFEWKSEGKSGEESSHFHQCQYISTFKYFLMSRCCLHGMTSEFFVTSRHRCRHGADPIP